MLVLLTAKQEESTLIQQVLDWCALDWPLVFRLEPFMVKANLNGWLSRCLAYPASVTCTFLVSSKSNPKVWSAEFVVNSSGYWTILLITGLLHLNELHHYANDLRNTLRLGCVDVSKAPLGQLLVSRATTWRVVGQLTRKCKQDFPLFHSRYLGLLLLWPQSTSDEFGSSRQDLLKFGGYLVVLWNLWWILNHIGWLTFLGSLMIRRLLCIFKSPLCW